MISHFQLEILTIAALTAFAATLPGIFLVLRGVALMSDAISHAILLGVAVMFLIVGKLDSLYLMIGACCAGILTVVCTEFLITTQRIKKDAAIGLVFPLFFSIGIVLITQYAHNVHLDCDMVLLGELAFAPFNRWSWGCYDMGPIALWSVVIIGFINVIFSMLFYKELTITTFDKDFAYVVGFNPTLIHYILMCITSITAVGIFDVVGSIVVVALMITPPATAYLFTNNLSIMIFLSIGLSISASLCGYTIAHLCDVSIAGALAATCGLFFIVGLLLSPQKGIFSTIYAYQKHRKRTLLGMIIVYIYQQPDHKATLHDITYNLHIKKTAAQSAIKYAITAGMLIKEVNGYFKTPKTISNTSVVLPTSTSH